MLWATKATAWPCWLGWALLGAGGEAQFRASPHLFNPLNVALDTAFSAGMALLLVFTCRVLLQAPHPWRIDRTYLRAVSGVCALFLPTSVLQTLVALVTPTQPLWILVTMPPVIATLALVLWPFGAAFGDLEFTARAALRLMGRTFWTTYWAVAWMSLIVLGPVFVAVIIFQFDRDFLPLMSGIIMSANVMVWASVLAAVYGLWRRRRSLDTELHAIP